MLRPQSASAIWRLFIASLVWTATGKSNPVMSVHAMYEGTVDSFERLYEKQGRILGFPTFQ